MPAVVLMVALDPLGAVIVSALAPPPEFKLIAEAAEDVICAPLPKVKDGVLIVIGLA